MCIPPFSNTKYREWTKDTSGITTDRAERAAAAMVAAAGGGGGGGCGGASQLEDVVAFLTGR